MKMSFFLILISMSLFANIINIDEKTNNISLINLSNYFVDTNGKLSLKEIKEQKFQKTNKEIINIGYGKKENIWVKLIFKNSSNSKITKVLVAEPVVLANVFFYDENKLIKKDGRVNNYNREYHANYLKITLKPKEIKTFYIMANSYKTPLKLELTLYTPKVFNKIDEHYKMIISAFFASMLVLLLYNFFIWTQTKDKTYLYYCFYLSSVILHHSIYVGILQLLPKENIFLYFYLPSNFYVNLFVLGSLFFAREYLEIKKQSSKIDRGFSILIWLNIITAFLSFDNFILNTSTVILLTTVTMLFLIGIGFVSLFNGNENAKYYVLGWSILIFSLLFSLIFNLAIFDYYSFAKYALEVGFLSEAILFSFGLASRINRLRREKDEVNQKLFNMQQSEKERLNTLLEIKTKDLKEKISEREILIKEINHRVKNNLQQVVNLLLLQKSFSEDEKLKANFDNIKNRVLTISLVQDLLYNSKNLSKIDMREYLSKLLKAIKESFGNKKIQLISEIESFYLSIEDSIKIGMFCNEAVTNAYKYAFKETGEIRVDLEKIENKIKLSIKDNGVGIKPKTIDKLGNMIMSDIANSLKSANFNIKVNSGTEVILEFKIIYS